MAKIVDMTGKRFGRLLVLERDGSTNFGAAKWSCACDCGTISTHVGQTLRAGEATSCGCAARELLMRKNTRHGKRGTKEYRVWNNMLQRTTNKKHNRFPDYGGRGITVCAEWMDFQNFFADMGLCPDGCTLDRINNELGYGKSNCRWASKSIQSRNTRRSTSDAVGVGLAQNGKYYARITAQGRSIFLGMFDSIDEAKSARAYGEATYWAASAKPQSVV